MKPVLFAPFLILALSACAVDGTQGIALAPIAQTAPTVQAAPVPVAASVATMPASIPASTGEIVLVEPVRPTDQRGSRAALAIGATVLGAFIPGPWGSVAGVTAGQAGQYALSEAQTGTVRYHVRMSDGTVRTVTQDDPLAMGVGTPVRIVTLGDGAPRLEQTALPATVATTQG